MSPEIKRLGGLRLCMYDRNEHNAPHLHVYRGEDCACISIRSQRVTRGALPGKALKLAQAWIRQHKDELLRMWDARMEPGVIHRIDD